MFSLKHTLTFVLILAILRCTNSCFFNAKYERAHCNSFSDLLNAGSHPEWKKLNMISSGNEPFSPIKKGSFVGQSNVKDLQIKGLANGIEPGAWDGLSSLYELHLDNNKLNVISAEVFANVTCEVIYIYFCEVQQLMPASFNSLPNINRVYIYGNNISTISEGVFTNTDIGLLFLRMNKIKNVEPNAFRDMDNLKFLSLEENELTTFSAPLSIGFAPQLTHLYINRNNLTKLNQDMFTMMPNLQVLLININQIERFDDNLFQNIRHLTLLDISNNRLEELQTNVFSSKGMKNLEILFLHENKLSFLSPEVLERLPNLKKITISGNPWQCPCLDNLETFLTNHNMTKLCEYLYKKSGRPSCVYTDLETKNCVYNIKNVKNIPKIYEEQTTEYAKLPPVCNVDGVEEPVLGF